MAKFQSPLLGYNNNVRHKNRVFHIQTEDSGVGHPHLITHLFMDGGRILKSVKTSYAEHVGTEGMKETVRGMMKEQHKAMFIALRDGQYDHLVDPGAAAPAPVPAPAGPAPAPKPSAAPPAGDAIVSAIEPVVAAPVPAPSEPEIVVAAPVPSAGPPTSPDPPRADLEPSPNTIDERKRAAVEPAPPPSAAQAKGLEIDDVPPPPSGRDAAAVPHELRVVIAEADPEDVPMTTRQPAEARPDAVAASAGRAVPPSGRELTLDFDALEHAAQDTRSSLFHTSDLPPPPKNLFAAKEPITGGAYRAVEPAARRDPREEATGRSDPREEPATGGSTRAPASTRSREESPHPARVATRSSPAGRIAGGDARYAPARPAAIFGNSQRSQPQSLFSDELVSDKSLDEVILSYLAEDLEPPRRK